MRFPTLIYLLILIIVVMNYKPKAIKQITLLFATFIAFMPLTLLSQGAKEVKEVSEKSKIENFSLKTGSLIKKDFLEIGTVKGVEVQIVILSDILANTKLSGIKLMASVYKSYGSSDKSCFLDVDEVEAFVKSGKYLSESLNEKADNYIEYQFTSRDGFQAGAYSDKKDSWKYYLKLEKYDSDSYVFMNKDDFQKLIELVNSAKAKL